MQRRLDRMSVSGAQRSEGEAGLAGLTGRRCFREFGVGFDQRASEWGQSSVSKAAAGSQKKRKATVRKESADTQECVSCQLNELEVDMDENKKELSFIPSAVRSWAGWHEPKFMCDKQCWKKALVRHHISNGAGHWRAVHDKPLQLLLQSEARRKEGASGKQHAMEASGR